MTKKRFIRHFALRNIQANKKSSSVIILTLSLVLTLLILLFSMHTVLSRVFSLEFENKYQDVDVVVNYDEYSLSRLVNKRQITDDYQTDIDYVLSFFNVNVLADYKGELFYANMISSPAHEFEILTGENVDVSGYETIISKSFAKDRELKVGDSFSFNILQKQFTYTVSEIVDDSGLFTGTSFYIDKSQLFEDLYGLGQLDNLGNTLYIKLANNVDKYDFIEMLKNDNNYKTYNIFPAIDDQYVLGRADEVSAMFLGVGLIIVIAIFLVVASLFPVIIRDIKKELGVVSTLGGNKNFIWKVYLLQWLILTVLAFAIALVLSLVIVNISAYIYGVKGFVIYNLLSLLLAFVTVGIFIYLGAKLSYKKVTDLSIIEQSANKRYEIVKINIWTILISFLLLILVFLINPFTSAINSLLIVLLSIYVAISLLSLFLKLITNIINKSKHKKSVFKLVQNKYINNNKHIHQSIKVLFISLIVIVLVFSIRSFMKSEVEQFDSEMNFDLALVNINDYQNSLLNEVKTEDINDAAPAVYYSNITVNFNQNQSELVKFFVSMDSLTQMDDYFSFNPDTIDQAYINSTLPYVILPKNFKLVYNLNPGDIIKLRLNYKLESVEVVIGGFFDTNFDNFVYSNIFEKPTYQNLVKINTIFIKTDSANQVFQNLVQKYSINMYYVFDANTYFGDYINMFSSVSDFFMILTGFMIICFLIVVFNNTLLMYYDLKTDFAKIKVLGADNREFAANLFKEFLILGVAILLIGIVEINILSIHLKNVILLVNFYKDISASLLDIVIGFLFTFAMLLLSYLYYFNKIRKTRIINEMKFY